MTERQRLLRKLFSQELNKKVVWMVLGSNFLNGNLTSQGTCATSPTPLPSVSVKDI